MTWLIAIAITVALAWAVWRYRPRSRTETLFGAARETLPPQFVVFDLETTGLDPARHRIIELAAVRVDMGSNRHDFIQAIVRIDKEVPAKITQITGITTEMTAQGDPIASVLSTFAEFVGDLPLVAFNAEFDLAFLHSEQARAGLPRTTNRCTCALNAARIAWPRRKSYKLSALAKGLGTSGAHRALKDCELAIIVYVAAIGEISAR